MHAMEYIFHIIKKKIVIITMRLTFIRNKRQILPLGPVCLLILKGFIGGIVMKKFNS